MYFRHLKINWCVALHALVDFMSHFVHGLVPFIKIKHHQPVIQRKILEVKNEY
jgi:hypothetical protein